MTDGKLLKLLQDMGGPIKMDIICLPLQPPRPLPGSPSSG